MIGRQIGNYRITRTLGEGGMGAVYVAFDELLEREVAIKALKRELAGEADLVERFRREAVILARLNHPNIATLFGLHREGDELFMVLELVTGRTLRTLLHDRGPMAPERVVDVCGQVLAALDAAHGAGIVHRDLKPANLMLTDTGLVKVMDFGIARVMGSARYTRIGHVCGTPAYMAPEQLRGLDGDGRVDFYALGVVAYQLLTGTLPFDDRDELALLKAKLNDAPVRLAERAPHVSAALDAALRRALATAPEDRFPDTGTFRAALGLPARATPSAGMPLPELPPTIAAAPEPAATPTGASTTNLTPPPGGAGTGSSTVIAAAPERRTGTRAVAVARASWLPFVAGAALAAIVAVGALRIWRQPGSTPAPDTQASATATAAAPPANVPPPRPAPPPAAAASTPSAPRTAPAASTPPVRAPRDTHAAPGTTAAPAEPSADAGGAEDEDTTEAAPPEAAAPAPSPSTPAAAPIVFHDIGLMVVEDNEPDEHDAVLSLGPSSLSISDEDSERVKTIRYADIVAATYAQAKRPRWKEGLIAAAAAGVFAAPVFFMKSTSHWLTLQTGSELTVLHLDKRNVQAVLPALEQRIGKPVAREIEAKKH